MDPILLYLLVAGGAGFALMKARDAAEDAEIAEADAAAAAYDAEAAAAAPAGGATAPYVARVTAGELDIQFGDGRCYRVGQGAIISAVNREEANAKLRALHLSAAELRQRAEEVGYECEPDTQSETVTFEHLGTLREAAQDAAPNAIALLDSSDRATQHAAQQVERFAKASDAQLRELLASPDVLEVVRMTAQAIARVNLIGEQTRRQGRGATMAEALGARINDLRARISRLPERVRARAAERLMRARQQLDRPGVKNMRAIAAELAYVEALLRQHAQSTAAVAVPPPQRMPTIKPARRSLTFASAGIEKAPGLIRGTAPLALVGGFNEARRRAARIAKQPPFSRSAPLLSEWMREQERLLGLYMRRGQTGAATGVAQHMKNAADVLGAVAAEYAKAFQAFDALERKAPQATIGRIRSRVRGIRAGSAMAAKNVLESSGGDPFAARRGLMVIAAQAVEKAQAEKRQLGAETIARNIVFTNARR